jgi:hypothetical protein
MRTSSAELLGGKNASIAITPELGASKCIAVNSESLSLLAFQEGIHYADLHRLSIIFTHCKLDRRYSDETTYGLFEVVDYGDEINFPEMPRIKLSIPAITEAVWSGIALDKYKYVGENATLNRNTSAVLTHELGHYSEYLARKNASEKHTFRSLAQVGIDFLMPDLARSRSELEAKLAVINEEARVRGRTREIFEKWPELEELVEVS